jgi:hypothetical protein
MTMRYVGYYSDIKQANSGRARESLPSIQAQPRSFEGETIAMVAHYLEGGQQLGAVPGTTTDFFNPDIRVSLDTLTDGEWIWPGDAAYYCRTYGIIPLDDKFIAEVVRHDGECPHVNQETLVALAKEWQSQAMKSDSTT